jgi:hypothetical protein
LQTQVLQGFKLPGHGITLRLLKLMAWPLLLLLVLVLVLVLRWQLVLVALRP